MSKDEFNQYQRQRYKERKKQKLGIKLNDALINMSEHDKSKNTDVRDDSDTNQLRIRLLEKQVEVYEL